MKPYQADFKQKTLDNSYFREVLYTSNTAQLVVMNIKPGEDIGLETHDLDQYLFFVQGSAKAILDGVESEVKPDEVVVVPKGVEHNFINTGSDDLKLFTIYAPAEHPDGTIHKTKAEAEAAEHH